MITFAIVYWLEASHRSHPYLRGVDHTKTYPPEDGDHGATIQSVHHHKEGGYIFMVTRRLNTGRWGLREHLHVAIHALDSLLLSVLPSFIFFLVIRLILLF